MITPIETEYAGYKFRSRLEARWAYFFDCLDIRYEYEREGYHIGQKWYLPDFWLPDLHYWIEVKPAVISDYGTLLCPPDGKLVYELQSVNGGQGFILAGAPGYYRSPYGALELEYQAFPAYDTDYLWCVCPDCRSLGLEFEGRSDRLPCKRNGCPTHDSNHDRTHTYTDREILGALNLAKHARFEHGDRVVGRQGRITGRYVMDASRLPY